MNRTKFERAAEQYGYYKRADGMWTDDAEILRGYGIAPNVYLSAEDVCREEQVPLDHPKTLDPLPVRCLRFLMMIAEEQTEEKQ